jgi:uncharacterized protein (TIRG00374 family)
MSSDPERPNSGGQVWVGYIVAAACLLWVFHDVRWGDLSAHVKAMRLWLLVPAIAADIASYAVQGARWSLLVRPMGRLSFLKSAQAIYAALFVNEVLPLRLGEILRSYLISRWTSLTMSQVVSSILVERFLDGVWTALAFGLVVLVVPLPRFLVDAEEILAFTIFAAAAFFIYLVVRKERHIDEVSRGRFSGLIGQLAAALRVIGRAPSFYEAAALSGLVLILQVLSFWLVMESYGLSLSLWHGAAVLLIVHVGTIVPGAPSNIGTYQLFTVLGLMAFEVDKTVATGFSVVVFLILTIPLWILGFVAFGRAKLSLRIVREEVARFSRR